MRANDLLSEGTDFDIVDRWVSGFNQDLRQLQKIAEFDKYKNIENDTIYRIITLSPTRVLQILHKGKTIVLNPKRRVISFSWTAAGAKSIMDSGYEHNGVQVLIRKKLIPDSLVFNLHQWGKENPTFPDRRVIAAEKELLVVPDPEYLTISPDDIINAKKAFTDAQGSF